MATRQFLKSPRGGKPNSRLSIPELPPSSATVTNADRLSENAFSPLRSTDKPVPPPIATIHGPLRWEPGIPIGLLEA